MNLEARAGVLGKPVIVVLVWVAACTSAPPAEPRAQEVGSDGVVVECFPDDNDSDGDGIGNRCELAFARAFAPGLIVAPGGCNWDTSVAGPRLGGEYLFAVQGTPENGVRIAYLPAYYRDCGWEGSKCWLPWVDCSPHAGDSEAIILDLTRVGSFNRWQVDGVFLSAHCFGHGEDCRWYRGDQLRTFTWMDGDLVAPLIWVSEGKQANYPDVEACNQGHWFIDTCNQNSVGYRFPVRSQLQNIGSRDMPAGSSGGCVTAYQVGSSSSVPVPDVEECFWESNRSFGGWLGKNEGGSTPYWKYLIDVGEF